MAAEEKQSSHAEATRKGWREEATAESSESSSDDAESEPRREEEKEEWREEEEEWMEEEEEWREGDALREDEECDVERREEEAEGGGGAYPAWSWVLILRQKQRQAQSGLRKSTSLAPSAGDLRMAPCDHTRWTEGAGGARSRWMQTRCTRSSGSRCPFAVGTTALR